VVLADEDAQFEFATADVASGTAGADHCFPKFIKGFDTLNHWRLYVRRTW
jgi:hypothetical protein